MKYFYSLILLGLLSVNTYAQQIKKILFLGNSYTSVNNLPLLLHDVAKSLGDSVYYDSNTPGGYTFQLHSTNATTIAKINAEKWDNVVLQEQSEVPSLSDSLVQTDCFPYADTLNKFIKTHDSCTQVVFYMTWGRKNGDTSYCASYPPVCTYKGMQERLRESYIQLGQMFNAEVAPVGIVWKAIRDSSAIIDTIELYASDGSHPSINGSYLAACTFYATIFHKSPIGASYPSGVLAIDAMHIQQYANTIVFDSLSTWNIDTTSVHAAFTVNLISPGQYQFQNTSWNALSYIWYFGDRDTSSLLNPIHTYLHNSIDTISLVAFNNCIKDSVYYILNVGNSSVVSYSSGNNSIHVFPNPANNEFSLYCNSCLNSYYKIIDVTGNTLQSGILKSNYESIDISKISQGIYMIQIFNGNRISSERFVKSK